MASKSSTIGFKSERIKDSPIGIYRTALLSDVLQTVTIPDRDAVANELNNDYMAPFYENILSVKSEIGDSLMQSSGDLFDISKSYPKHLLQKIDINRTNGKYTSSQVSNKTIKLSNGSKANAKPSNGIYTTRKRRFSASNISDIEHQISFEDLSEKALFDLSISHSNGSLLPTTRQVAVFNEPTVNTKEEFQTNCVSRASLPSLTGLLGEELSPQIEELGSQLDVSRQAILGQPCPICGDKISGFHYGIYSCESCKGFFKRTVQNKKNYMCMRGSSCIVSMVTRKKCPACRFKKCLTTGMKLEAIREDRTRGGRSTYRLTSGGSNSQPYGNNSSLHYDDDPSTNNQFTQSSPLQNDYSDKSVSDNGLSPSQSTNQETSPLATSESEKDISEDDLVISDIPRLPWHCKQLNSPVPELIQNLMKVEPMWHFSEKEMKEMKESFENKVVESDPNFVSNLMQIADYRLYKIVRWCKNLPLFKTLGIDDQISLLLNAWCSLLLFSVCYRSLSTPDEIRFSLDKTMTLKQAKKVGFEPLIERLLNLTSHMRRLQLDEKEYACLKVIILLSSDVSGLKEPDRVLEYQERVLAALREYTTSHYPNKPNKFGEMLLRIPELERVCYVGKDTLTLKHKTGELQPSVKLMMELLQGGH